MKKLIIVLFLAVGVAQAASVFIPKLKSAKQEVSKTVTKTVVTPQYSTEVVSFCPRNLPNSVTSEAVYENGVELFKHCEKCRTGVYAQHKDEEGRTCSFCGDKE